jgi:tRNA wybutosine-synthesizing protein 3
LEIANVVLVAANQAGFRESGAMNLSLSEDGTISPMVAVRSMGLGLDCVVGQQQEDGSITTFVDESHLEMLARVSNERFEANVERIGRFRENMRKAFGKVEDDTKEDFESRRRRKKAEGLARQSESRRAVISATGHQDVDEVLGGYSLEMLVPETSEQATSTLS